MFSSPLFLFVFLPCVLALHLAGGKWLRNTVLLLASLLFYAWQEQVIVLVLLLSIAVNHVTALAIERRANGPPARGLLAASLTFNLGLLIAFKYSNWIHTQLSSLGLIFGLGELPPLPEIPLPIGISFFTFQAMSYVVDVYRGEVRVHRNPLHFATYLALFPQLIAGPIVRYRDLAAELAERRVDLAGFSYGVRRFLIGLGKKLLVADTLAVVSDRIFEVPPGEHSAALAWLGITCYTLQIYFDFSGYSDMAIGLGRMFGLRFLENFNFPYIAQSVTEFWRRWHISLSTWFRDYLYVPLGGNRAGRLRTYGNLLIVFFLCGLWHGASWNFVVWGLFHGFLLVVERLGGARLLSRVPRVIGHAYLLLAVMIGWVFFRAPDLGYAVDFLASLVGFSSTPPGAYPIAVYLDPVAATALAAGAIGSLPWLPRLRARLAHAPQAPRVAFETVALLGQLMIFFAVAAKLAVGTYSPFIYFRF